MRLLLRLQWPVDRPMVVEANPDGEFLERAWKLTRICEKIRRTMGGPGKVLIDNSRGNYIALRSVAEVRRLVMMAGVKEWNQVRWLWIPETLRFNGCVVLAGMRSHTLVDEDGVWFEGTDGTNSFVSVRLEKDWLRREVSQ